MSTKNTPKTEPKQSRKPKPYALSQFEIEQHEAANKAMSTIYAPC